MRNPSNASTDDDPDSFKAMKFFFVNAIRDVQTAAPRARIQTKAMKLLSPRAVLLSRKWRTSLRNALSGRYEITEGLERDPVISIRTF
jgi:hypothetical protein